MKTLWGLAESNYIPSFNTFCTRLVVLALFPMMLYVPGPQSDCVSESRWGNGDNASVASVTRAEGPLGRK